MEPLDRDYKRQTVAYLISNGHTWESVNNIPNDVFNDIMTLYERGSIGPKAIVRELAKHASTYINCHSKTTVSPVELLGQSSKYFWFEETDEERNESKQKQLWDNAQIILAMQKAQRPDK